MEKQTRTRVIIAIAAIIILTAASILTVAYRNSTSQYLYLDLERYKVDNLLVKTSNEQRESIKLGELERGVTRDVVFSPNGKNFAYIVRVDRPPSYGLVPSAQAHTLWAPADYYLVVNGHRVSPLLDTVGEISFSADNSSFFYAALTKKEQWVLVRNFEVIKTLPGLGRHLTPLNDEATRFVYVQREDDKEQLIYDGEPLGDLFDRIGDPNFRDGKLYNVHDKENILYQALNFIPHEGPIYPRSHEIADTYLVRGGVKGKAYTVIEDFFVSPDGASFAFATIVGTTTDRENSMRFDTSHIIKDGHQLTEFDRAFAPVIPPTGGIAFTAREYHPPTRTDLEFIVINGVKGQPHHGVSGLTFSPDGSRYAYLANTRSESLVMLDGHPLKHDEYDSVSRHEEIVFSSDNRHIAFVATLNADSPNRKYGRFSVVINGKAGRGYTQIITTPQFTDDNSHIMYGARSDREIWWVVDAVQ